jgi:hypothetical protein
MDALQDSRHNRQAALNHHVLVRKRSAVCSRVCVSDRQPGGARSVNISNPVESLYATAYAQSMLKTFPTHTVHMLSKTVAKTGAWVWIPGWQCKLT